MAGWRRSMNWKIKRPGSWSMGSSATAWGGAPRDAPLAMIEWTVAQTAPVISLDVPSGIDATSGKAPGAHVVASVTLTLALPKTGLDVAAAGDLFLADIGIPREVYRRSEIDVPAHIFGGRYRVSVRPQLSTRGQEEDQPFPRELGPPAFG
jgi:hypothetical protein